MDLDWLSLQDKHYFSGAKVTKKQYADIPLEDELKRLLRLDVQDDEEYDKEEILPVDEGDDDDTVTE